MKLKWKKSGIRQDGFFAHEVDEVLDYAVSGEKDATLVGLALKFLSPIWSENDTEYSTLALFWLEFIFFEDSELLSPHPKIKKKLRKKMKKLL